MVSLQVANALIGNSNAWALQNKRPTHTRSFKNVLCEHNFVDSFGSINMNFSDSGLWGLLVSGQAANGNEMVNLLCQELDGLRTISDLELETAKNTLKIQITLGLERSCDRLNETLQNLRTYGRVLHTEYATSIDAVSSESIADAVNKALSSNPTFVAMGGDVGVLPGFESLQSRLR